MFKDVSAGTIGDKIKMPRKRYETPHPMGKEDNIKVVGLIPSSWAGEGFVNAELYAGKWEYENRKPWDRKIAENTRLTVLSSRKMTLTPAADIPFEDMTTYKDIMAVYEGVRERLRMDPSAFFFPGQLPSSVFVERMGHGRSPEEIEKAKTLISGFIRNGYLGKVDAYSWLEGQSRMPYRESFLVDHREGTVTIEWNDLSEGCNTLEGILAGVKELRLKEIPETAEEEKETDGEEATC